MNSGIPLVDLKAQYNTIRPEIDAAIDRVINAADFIQGEDVRRLEQEFAAYCEVEHAVGVASGTEALYLALLASGIGSGDEVITTPFTFIATAEAVSQTGAAPVFVDIDAGSFNMDPAKVEASITSRTRAILPVHLYGRMADMDPLMALAERYGLIVIEDAAQAHGARYNGRRAGSIGHAGCFSFYPGKNLGAYGDAGMVVTHDPDMASAVRMLRDHGREGKYEHLRLGVNGRLDTLQAAVVRAKLPHLEQWNARRRRIALMYGDLLRETPLGLPKEQAGYDNVYHLFSVRAQDRASLQDALKARNIASGVHYPIPLHLQPAYRGLGYRPGDFPDSERAAAEVVSLPLYPEMTDDQVVRVAEAVREALADPVAADKKYAPRT